mgnify:CR=1 FL=1
MCSSDLIALRRVLPASPIYVLNGLLAGTEGDLVEHNLTPVLNHLGQLNAWRAAAQRFNRPLDAVIHIDTGLNRLGFEAEQEQLRLQFELHVYAGLRARGEKAAAERFLADSPVRAAFPKLLAKLNLKQAR